MNTNTRFSKGGDERLRDAIEKEVRDEFQEALAVTTEYWARIEVEKRIDDEVKGRMKDVASPQSLWDA